MIINKNFVFIHIPKTGGTWMRTALRMLPCFEHEYKDHRTVIPIGQTHKPVLAAVRNPWDFHVSRYTHFHHNFEKQIHEFDRKNKGPTQVWMTKRFGGSFEQYVRHVFESSNDALSNLYRMIPADTHILQFENGLADGVLQFLNQVKAPAPAAVENKIRQMANSRFNAHSQHRSGAYYTPELHELILKHEQYVISRWAYSAPEELLIKQS